MGHRIPRPMCWAYTLLFY